MEPTLCESRHTGKASFTGRFTVIQCRCANKRRQGRPVPAFRHAGFPPGNRCPFPPRGVDPPWPPTKWRSVASTLFRQASTPSWGSPARSLARSCSPPAIAIDGDFWLGQHANLTSTIILADHALMVAETCRKVNRKGNHHTRIGQQVAGAAVDGLPGSRALMPDLINVAHSAVSPAAWDRRTRCRTT